MTCQLLRSGGVRDAGVYRSVRALAHAMAADSAAGHAARAMCRFVDFWNGPGTWDGMGIERRAALASQVREVVGDFCAIHAEPPRLDTLARLRTPTLVLQGGRGPLPAVLASRRVEQLIPLAQRVRLRGAGHMAPRTYPATVNLLVTAQLELAERRAERARASAIAAPEAA